MFAIVPIILYVFFVLLKPQEIVTALTAFQPLYLLPLLVGVGFVFDAGRYGVGAGKIRPVPYLYWALGLAAWSLVTMAANGISDWGPQLVFLGTALLMALPVAHCVQSWNLYRIAAAGILAMSVFFAYAGAHQALNPTRCFIVDPINPSMQYYEGRPCPGPFDSAFCYREDDPEGIKYVCEHPGILNTSSVNGRIRFRAQLEDPNELSLMCGIAFPFAVAFFAEKKTIFRFLVLLVSFVIVGGCVFFSQSRGGRLVLAVVLATFFIRRFGWKVGAIVFAVAAVPILAVLSMGGRNEAEAEGSALERTECLQVGLELLIHKPIVGVGRGQFTQHHFLTAHNSYVLAASELGIFGFSLWSSVMYIAVKTPIAALRALVGRTDSDAAVARAWATAILASTLGMTFGSFFLSFTFHPVLWLYIGMSGALASVVRRQIPDFRVGFSRKEYAAIFCADVALMAIIFAYTKYKLG